MPKCFFSKSGLFAVNILAMVLLCSVSHAQTKILDRIANDFKPISGYIVSVQGSECIIDLDHSKGVLIGDVFSVSHVGHKIVHPVTHDVLGTTKDLMALLKVVKTQAGYSLAQLVYKKEPVKAGDPITRYEGLNAVFFDHTGQGKQLFTDLQQTLPFLTWQGYDFIASSKIAPNNTDQAVQSLLTFSLTHSGIEIYIGKSDLLRKYSFQPDNETFLGDKIQAKKPNRAVPVDSQAIKTIAALPFPVLMADLLAYKNSTLLAATDGHQIEIFDVNQNLKVLAKQTFLNSEQILCIKWWCPSNQDTLYLAVNIWKDKALASRILKLTSSGLIQMGQDIPCILGTFDLNSDQRPEIILSQGFDSENFYGYDIHELIWSKDKLVSTNPSFGILPQRFPVIGSMILGPDKQGHLKTAFIRNNILYIYLDKDQIYKSPKHMGGSLSSLNYDIFSSPQASLSNHVNFEVSPIYADVDGDRRPVFISVASQSSVFGAITSLSDIKESWLSLTKEQDSRFTHATLGDKLTTPIQALALIGNRIMFVTTQPENMHRKTGQSYLLAYFRSSHGTH